jgi:hypothetical protein
MCAPAVCERGLRISASVFVILGEAYTPPEQKLSIKGRPFIFIFRSIYQRGQRSYCPSTLQPFILGPCYYYMPWGGDISEPFM